MSKPARPNLTFDSFDALLADAARLRDVGYEKAGAWDLGMILDHVAKSIASPFNPDSPSIPAPLRPVARLIIHRMVTTRKFPTLVKIPSPKALRPTPGIDARTAYAELEAAVARINAVPGDTIEGPPMKSMPRSEFVGQQLVHAAHHMGFLSARA